ncbi:protein IQ-DOMAIN 14-like [Senna tora]|uniref:Protein IQ-DOMAIN 14-like n=1 Tax=Senna tora TaxID=362788 RepID=A0A834T245_9FABA|nr:protein IQ-DOMAIN 14-like [Senna tora]
MGFLRRLFGGKKSGSPAGGSDNKSGSDSGPGKSKRRWSLIKHSKGSKSQIATTTSSDLNGTASLFSDSLNANKHAIAVAAATAAVAEAALAAAQAAAEVVRLTSGGGGGEGSVPSTSSLPAAVVHGGARQHRWPEEVAAVKIQSAFRGYLAKRALRALKALVKLQALVRGHIVRKKTADMLRRMQTLVRLQSQARAGRVHLSHTLHSTKSTLSHQHPVPEYYEHPLRAYSTKFEGSSLLKRSNSNAYYREIGSERARFGSNWFDRWIEENVWDHPRAEKNERSDKILEVDTWKPHLKPSQNEKSLMASYLASSYDQYDSPTRTLNQTLFGSLNKFPKGIKESQKLPSRTAESSPEPFSSASSRRIRAPFTPTRSECGYMGHPNYMANTESSRAKVRSMSAPRQRVWDSGPNSEGHGSSSSSHLMSRFGGSNLRS